MKDTKAAFININIPKNKYKCIHCGYIVERESDKKWIKSYCEMSGKNIRLQLIKAKK